MSHLEPVHPRHDEDASKHRVGVMKPIDTKRTGEPYGWIFWLAVVAVGVAMLPG